MTLKQAHVKDEAEIAAEKKARAFRFKLVIR
jgi:hypothetical protein